MAIRLELEITVNDAGAVTAVKRVGDEADKTKDKLKDTGAQGNAAMDGLARKALEYAASWIAVSKAVGLFKDSLKEAVSDQLMQRQLANNMIVLGGATKESSDRAREWVTELALAAGVSKSELIPSLEKLVGATHNLQAGQTLLQIATEAAQKGIGEGMSSNVDIMAKYIASGTVLVRGGNAFAIQLKDATRLTKDHGTALDILGGKVAAMGDVSDTAAVQIQKQKVAWQETKEAMGYMVTGLLVDALPAIEKAALFVALFAGGLNKLGTDIRTTAIAVDSDFKQLALVAQGRIQEAEIEDQDAVKRIAALHAAANQSTDQMLDATVAAFAAAQKKISDIQGGNTPLKGLIPLSTSEMAAAAAIAQKQNEAEKTALQGLAGAEMEYARAKEAAAKAGMAAGGTSPDAIKAGLAAEVDARRAAFAEEYNLLQAHEEKSLAAEHLTATAKKAIIDTFFESVRAADLKEQTDEAVIQQHGTVLYLDEYKRRGDQAQSVAVAQKVAEVDAAKAAQSIIETDLVNSQLHIEALYGARVNVAMAEYSKEVMAADGAAAQMTAAYQTYIKAKETADKQYAQESKALALEKIALEGQVIGSIGRGISALAGKNRAMFIAGQAASASETIINAYVAWSKASAQGGIYGFAFGAAIFAAIAGFVSQITAQKPPSGQAHAGMNLVPETGSYILKQGEAVVPEAFNPYAFGMGGRSGASGGSGTSITIDARGAWFDSDEAVNRMAARVAEAHDRGRVN